MSTILEKGAVGGQATGFMLVKACEKRVTQKKMNYLDMVLADMGGEIVAKLWDYSPSRFGEYSVGMIIKVKGVIDIWNNTPQLKIEKIRAAADNDDVSMNDFIACAPISSEDMLSEIRSTVEGFQNEDIAKIVDYLINERTERLLCCSAAVRMHHTMRGGLLYHTLSMLRLGKGICDVYPFLNPDLVYAGIIIHDLGKLDELGYTDAGIASEYTNQGNMVGHIVGGAVNISKAGDAVQSDPETVMLLQHIVISHHENPEFGSPILPMFPEAQVVATVDRLDAGLFEMCSALSGIEKGSMTPRVFGLDRKLYRHGDDVEYRLK